MPALDNHNDISPVWEDYSYDSAGEASHDEDQQSSYSSYSTPPTISSVHLAFSNLMNPTDPIIQTATIPLEAPVPFYREGNTRISRAFLTSIATIDYHADVSMLKLCTYECQQFTWDREEDDCLRFISVWKDAMRKGSSDGTGYHEFVLDTHTLLVSTMQLNKIGIIELQCPPTVDPWNLYLYIAFLNGKELSIKLCEDDNSDEVKVIYQNLVTSWEESNQFVNLFM